MFRNGRKMHAPHICRKAHITSEQLAKEAGLQSTKPIR